MARPPKHRHNRASNQGGGQPPPVLDAPRPSIPISAPAVTPPPASVPVTAKRSEPTYRVKAGSWLADMVTTREPMTAWRMEYDHKIDVLELESYLKSGLIERVEV